MILGGLGAFLQLIGLGILIKNLLWKQLVLASCFIPCFNLAPKMGPHYVVKHDIAIAHAMPYVANLLNRFWIFYHG